MDHALALLEQIQTFLDENVPLTGGWLAVRMQTPAYPHGTIDITDSTPLRGQGPFYMEEHTGIISVWTRPTAGAVFNPAEAYTISGEVHQKLGSAVLSTQGITVNMFACGALRKRTTSDGLTFGRSFIFTATTNEV